MRGREELALTATPPPRCCFFAPAHISLRCPHDLNSWNRLSRDKSRDQCSMSRNIQITEQKDLQMSSVFLAFRWQSEGEKLTRKKNDGRLKGKRGRKPSVSPQSPLVFSCVRFNAPTIWIPRSIIWMHGTSKQMRERAFWIEALVRNTSSSPINSNTEGRKRLIYATYRGDILCEDLPQVVLKQCDELQFVNINVTASPGLRCLKAGKKERGWITPSTG